MNNYNFYVSKTASAPLIGKFVTEETTGKTYAILQNSPKLKRGKLLIARERNEEGETGHVERYYITNIIPVHNTQPLKKVKIHLETESEHAERKTQTRHFWIPVVISIFALFRPELISIAQWLFELCSGK